MTESTLVGKVALIAGGGRGIGAATAKLLAHRGALVVVNYLKNEQAAHKVVADIQAGGHLALSVQADVREQEQVQTMIENVLEEAGHIDILVDSIASFAFVKPFADLTWDEFLWGIQSELQAAFELTKALIPHIQKQQYGRLVYVGSGLAKEPSIEGGSSISVAKAGLAAFARSIAKEYASSGITANVVSPAMVETALSERIPSEQRKRLVQMIPLGRLAQPEDIAKVIAFLASDDSGFMTGTTLSVNGGIRME